MVQQRGIKEVEDARAEDQAKSGPRERRVHVRISSGRSQSCDATSGRTFKSTLRPDWPLTFCALGGPDPWGATGPQYYFC